LSHSLSECNQTTKIPRPKHLIHQLPHMVDVLIPDLHKDTAGFMKQLPRQQQPVAEIGEVGVDAEFPGVAEGADLLRLAG